MSIFKNIVGKLWLTIITLVALVILILGFFIYRYIDNNFPGQSEQIEDMERLAFSVADNLADSDMDSSSHLHAVYDVLRAQNIGLIPLYAGGEAVPVADQVAPVLTVDDILDADELELLLQGEVIRKSFRGSVNQDHVQNFMAVAVPVAELHPSDHFAALIVYQSVRTSEDLQLYMKRLFAIVAVFGFILATLFAFFLIAKVTKPLKQLRQAANLITQGQYSTRVAIINKDELGELAQTFNLMGEQLEETINAVNHERANLSRVLRSMSDAVISFDNKRKVILTNPRGEILLQEWSEIMWSTEDTKPTSTTNSVPEPLQMLFDEVVQETKVVYTKLHVQQGVWSVVMAPLYSHKLVRGAVAVLRDVTEENRLEKLRKDFVANVSHELRTPLSMLQGYSEALLDDIVTTPEDRTELAQVIHDESLRMGRLVKDLLDLARMEAGHIEMNLGYVELSPLFRRVHRKFLALCRERDITLECEFPSDDEVLYQADQDRLEQVLTNLLDNAIRHMTPGKSIYLRYQTLSYQDSSAALIEVEDEGKGIDPEDLPYVFERFYKADKARTRGTSGGTGLGLAIVKNIVEAHMGSVNVRSVVGEGTTFSIILPITHPGE